MKILVISDKPPWPGNSGGALAVRATLLGLVQNGAEVDLISILNRKYRTGIVPDYPDTLFKGCYRIVNIRTGIKPLRLLLNLLLSRKPYNVTRYYSRIFAKRLSESISGNSYDLVQVEGINMSVYLKDIRKLCNCHIAYRAHNIESEIWSELALNEKSRIKKSYFKVLSQRMHNYELEFIRKCDMLVPICDRDLNYFHAKGIRIPSYACPYGINIGDKKQKKGENRRDLIYIGSLDWRPNQEGMIWFLNTVWPQVKEKDPDVKLTIAGRNAPQWFIKLIVDKGVDYMGEADNASEFIASGSILVVPLLSGSGIRIRIIQAMTLGVPVITTKKGIQGINAESPDEILVARNATQFSGYILELRKDNKKRMIITDKAAKFISKNYDNKLLNKGLLDFYTAQL